MKEYLESSTYIDWIHPGIVKMAAELAKEAASDAAIAENCFVFVRDQIRHSWDYRLNPVTCKASDVLRHGTGYCYAKSHLLAALLRANGIPAGLCYQRLSINDNGAPFCLHGLNAVFLEQYGWYRMDARGNKAGVDARFSPPIEQLAFALKSDEESDLPGIFAEPLPEIVHALTHWDTVELVLANLPDVKPG